MFKRGKLDRVLKQLKKSKSNYFSGELNNIAFLDFDGVINLDKNNYTGPFSDKECIDNLNKLCLENNFKIVVISSWRKYSNYKEILYNSGLNKNIEILGATDILEKDREAEIIDYLDKHDNTNMFIILDDGEFNELSKFQVKTDFKTGFDDKKYNEALDLIKRNKV